jgi:hypothetical protein
MTPLELELTALGVETFPETPPIAEAVRRRIEAEPVPRRRLRRRRVLALALVVVAAGLGAALSVPQARSSILHWFGIGGVTVERVDRLPEIPTGSGPDVGVRTTLAEARQQVAFPIVVPTEGGYDRPDAVYVGRFAVQEVTLLYGRPGRIRLLLTEARGDLDVRFAGKLAARATRIEQLRVEGSPALWIEGAPHAFFFVGPNRQIVEGTLRLARNTLIWQRGRVLLRIEGELTRAEALEIADSVR